MVRPTEYERAGQIVLRAYQALPGYVSEPAYEHEVADVATRAGAAEVAVAVIPADGGQGEVVVGCVTFVPDVGNQHAEFDDPDAAGFRMLGVEPGDQGRGAGRALVQWCVDRAAAGGRRRLIIHSTPWMTRAHALYERFGFVRRPDLDWQPTDEIALWGFVLELPG
jgi:GNAT superfamily N-acetyltransferase